MQTIHTLGNVSAFIAACKKRFALRVSVKLFEWRQLYAHFAIVPAEWMLSLSSCDKPSLLHVTDRHCFIVVSIPGAVRTHKDSARLQVLFARQYDGKTSGGGDVGPEESATSALLLPLVTDRAQTQASAWVAFILLVLILPVLTLSFPAAHMRMCVWIIYRTPLHPLP
jgi:hypothetical protein